MVPWGSEVKIKAALKGGKNRLPKNLVRWFYQIWGQISPLILNSDSIRRRCRGYWAELRMAEESPQLPGSEGYWASSGLPLGSILTASCLFSSREVVVLNHRGQGHSFWWKGAPGDIPVSDGICSLPLFQPACSWPACCRVALWCES